MADAQSRTDRPHPSKARGPSKDARSGARRGSEPVCGRWPVTEPRSFGPPLIGIDGMSALPVKASLAIGEAGLDLFRRQTQAATDFWGAVSAARAPWHVFAASTDYWSHVCRAMLTPTGDGARRPGHSSVDGGVAGSRTGPAVRPG
jgi:hypothetical protein